MDQGTGLKKLSADSWREVAILCPRKAWLQTMAAALRRRDLPVSIQSERDVKGDSPAYAWLYRAAHDHDRSAQRLRNRRRASRNFWRVRPRPRGFFRIAKIQVPDRRNPGGDGKGLIATAKAGGNSSALGGTGPLRCRRPHRRPKRNCASVSFCCPRRNSAISRASSTPSSRRRPKRRRTE